MAVTFTPNIGLAKPNEADLAKNWAVTPDYAQFNNDILQDKMEIVIPGGYNPTLGAATSAPGIGSGSVSGRYQECQGFVFGSFLIIFANPGISVGSGEYGISLPSVVDNVFHWVGTSFSGASGQNSIIGEGYAYDNSSTNNCMSLALDVVTVSGVSYVRLITEAVAGKTSRLFRDNMPFNVDHADTLSGNFFYKKL